MSSNTATTAAEVLVKLDHKLGGVTKGSWIRQEEYDFIESTAGRITESSDEVAAGPAPIITALITSGYYPLPGLTFEVALITPSAHYAYVVQEGDTIGHVMDQMVSGVQGQIGNQYKVFCDGSDNITKTNYNISANDGSNLTGYLFTIA